MPTGKMHLPFSVPVLEFSLEMPYVDMLNEYSDGVSKDKAKSKELDWSEYLVGNVVQEHAIEHEQWLTLTTQFEACFKHAVGKEALLEQYAHNQHQQRVQGRQSARRLLG